MRLGFDWGPIGGALHQARGGSAVCFRTLIGCLGMNPPLSTDRPVSVSMGVLLLS